MIRYRECQKNHAAHLGSCVVDGCGEFMPAGNEGTPEALRCAACDCHRNFHRREVEGETRTTTRPPPPPTNRYISFNNNNHHRHGALMMGFGGAESSSEELKEEEETRTTTKKRFRTKFTQEDKDKMTELAERIGWRMQKEEEEHVVRVCSELGIKRKVFKVWMHNNKHPTKPP
ncbi:hypothetical protein vseg_005293 [Gypsophila vaccaria]